MRRQASLHEEAKWHLHPRFSNQCVSCRELSAVSPTSRISVWSSIFISFHDLSLLVLGARPVSRKCQHALAFRLPPLVPEIFGRFSFRIDSNPRSAVRKSRNPPSSNQRVSSSQDIRAAKFSWADSAAPPISFVVDDRGTDQFLSRLLRRTLCGGFSSAVTGKASSIVSTPAVPTGRRLECHSIHTQRPRNAPVMMSTAIVAASIVPPRFDSVTYRSALSM